MRTAVLAAAFTVAFGGAASAFGCPGHIAEAQAMIDKVTADMGGEMSKSMPKVQIILVHVLLDDAKMRLNSAIHNHEKSRGVYDHARAIAKADSALAYARAADLLHFHYMQN